MKIRNNACPKCGGKNGTSSSYCASCHNEYQKAYYKKKPRSIDESLKRRRVSIREYVKAKKNIPCTDCGKCYPWYVMDFDHVRGKKKFNLSRSTSIFANIAAMEEEIAKCDVVCANCHRERTFKRVQLEDGVIGNITGLEPVR
jgi:hypothetical protein